MTKEYVRMNLTRDAMNKIIDLKYNKGLTWEYVAKRLGYDKVESLKNAVYRYRKGRYRFQYEKSNEELDRYLALRLNGDTNIKIASEYGTARSRVHLVLARAGWDNETINEERERGP